MRLTLSAYWFIIFFLHCPNRPAIYKKELYVDETARNQKVGEALMQALKMRRRHIIVRQ